MQIQDCLKMLKNALKDFSPTASLDAELILGHVLGLNRTDLILKSDLEISQRQENQIFKLSERRQNHEPIAYILNKQEFYGLDFYVDKNVLIPRPETEIMVEEVIELVKSLEFRVESLGQSLHIIDLGTGSGCIPISLASNLSNVDFTAIDISPEALEVARKNVIKHSLEDKIELREGNLLSKFRVENCSIPLEGDQGGFAAKVPLIITANLPYVEDSAPLEPEVKDHEPHLALFAGSDGLDLYRKLLTQIEKLTPLAIFLEIDPRQVIPLKKVVAANHHLSRYKIEIIKDLAGKERVFVLKLTEGDII